MSEDVKKRITDEKKEGETKMDADDTDNNADVKSQIDPLQEEVYIDISCQETFENIREDTEDPNIPVTYILTQKKPETASKTESDFNKVYDESEVTFEKTTKEDSAVAQQTDSKMSESEKPKETSYDMSIELFENISENKEESNDPLIHQINNDEGLSEDECIHIHVKEETEESYIVPTMETSEISLESKYRTFEIAPKTETDLNEICDTSQETLQKITNEDPTIDQHTDFTMIESEEPKETIYNVSEETTENIEFCEDIQMDQINEETTAIFEDSESDILGIISDDCLFNVDKLNKNISSNQKVDQNQADNNSKKADKFLGGSEPLLNIKILNVTSKAIINQPKDDHEVKDIQSEVGINRDSITKIENAVMDVDIATKIKPVSVVSDETDDANIICIDDDESPECIDLEEIATNSDQGDVLELRNDTGHEEDEISELEEKHRFNCDKLTIIYNIVKKCEELKNPGPKIEIPVNLVERIKFFTNLNTDYLKVVLKDYKRRNKSMRQAMFDTRHIAPDIQNELYSDVRDVFVELYIEKGQVPNKINLIKGLQVRSSFITKEFYKNLSLRTLVKNKIVNYSYIKYNNPKNSNKHMITENPELVYLRNKYLRQIVRLRQNLDTFTYISIINVDNTNLLGIAASPTTDLLETIETEVKNEENIRNWLQNLIFSLDPTSIIVIRQPKYVNNTPTMNSTKEEMIYWLSKRDVIFDIDYHRAELYSLIKLNKENTGSYDRIFRANGFQVIVNPVEYKKLDYFNPIREECIKQADNIISFMKKMGRADWAMLEDKIVEEEKQMLKKDRLIEKVVDNIFEMVKNGDLDEEDFPEECNATKFDKFDVNIGDIIVD